MTVINEENNRTNVYAKEPAMYTDPYIQEQMENGSYKNHNEKAELLNGRAAMLGFIAAVGAYALTGQIIPGLW